MKSCQLNLELANAQFVREMVLAISLTCNQQPKNIGNIEAILGGPLSNLLAGDENSVKYTRAFLDNWGMLMQEYDCTVLIIHHTGLSPEAQNRARGSSVWKGFLDIEINVKSVASDALALSQTKAKDSEQQALIFLELKQVPLLRRFDEEDEQITSAVIANGGFPDEQRGSGWAVIDDFTYSLMMLRNQGK